MYIDEAAFRDLYHKFVYIECPGAMDELRDVLEIVPGATGVLAYCFAEDVLGLSFNLLASVVKKEDGSFAVGPRSEESYARVRFRDVRDYTFLPAEETGLDLSEYEEVGESMLRFFESGDRKVTMLRDLEMLDEGRNLEFPDYISVTAGKSGYLPELVWVKLTGFGENVFFGELLEPPKQKLDYEAGQQVSFRAYDNEGSIMLILDRPEGA